MSISLPFDVTRRAKTYAIAGVMASALILPGCSSASSDSEQRASTRTVDDYFGSVDVPAAPMRVVAADPISLALMLSLDTKPVAASFNPLALP
ncbi:MAG: hypothetical protein WBA81_00250, partial [Rhodococcus sp. (in: high G+C Gram-positive bacteria)]